MGDAEWYFRMGGEVSGPYDLETMRGFRRSGLLKPETELSRDGLPQVWGAAADTVVFRDQPAASAAAVATKPPVSRDFGLDDRYAWLLAGLPLAYSLFEVQAYRFGVAPFYAMDNSLFGLAAYFVLFGFLINRDIARNKSYLDRGLYLSLIFPPIYFWFRRRFSKNGILLFVSFLISFGLSILITDGAMPYIGGANISSCYSNSVTSTIVKKLNAGEPVNVGDIKIIRSIREVGYDGSNRFCSASLVSSDNNIFNLEYSVEINDKDNFETYRWRILR